jgi:myosin V
MHLHEAAILHSLELRFDVDQIYTFTGPILIAVNPFKRIPGLYEDAVLQKFVETHAREVG